MDRKHFLNVLSYVIGDCTNDYLFLEARFYCTADTAVVVCGFLSASVDLGGCVSLVLCYF